MILTGAFLAAHAESVDGMLDVRGGTPGWLVIPGSTGDADARGSFVAGYLVVLMQPGPDDLTDPPHLRLEAADQYGHTATVFDVPMTFDPPVGVIRHWISPPISLPAAIEPGRLVLIATGDRNTLSIPIDLRRPPA